MRLSATKALLERRDTLVVATVSAIYGLGDPNAYMKMLPAPLHRREVIERHQILRRLAELQYTRNDTDFRRATYRVRGDVIDVFPADSEQRALRIELFDDEVDKLSWFDPLSSQSPEPGRPGDDLPEDALRHPARGRRKVGRADQPGARRAGCWGCASRTAWSRRSALSSAPRYDLEMLSEVGYCNGVENYSRYFSGRAPRRAAADAVRLPAARRPDVRR